MPQLAEKGRVSAREDEKEKAQVGAAAWSYGGGTQSAAIAVLVAQQRLPRPDCIVMADTGRELSETWSYLREYVQPLLSAVNLTVEVAPHSLATVDLYSRRGTLLIPAFQPSAVGRGHGQLPGYCSVEWKRRVVQRHLRRRGYGPQRPVDLWLGFSTDEAARRMKDSATGWITHRYPLVYDVPLGRAECRQVVLDAGLPPPPRSSCFMCPYHSAEEWRHIRETAPTDWARAIRLDRSIRERLGVSLHPSLRPLADAPLDEATESEPDACQTGFCFV